MPGSRQARRSRASGSDCVRGIRISPRNSWCCSRKFATGSFASGCSPCWRDFWRPGYHADGRRPLRHALLLVAQRRPEIGVRIALGARSEQVVGMMMREAARLLLIGSVAGVLISLFAGRTAASLSFGVTASDPLILGGACALLVAISAIASFLPAWRASRINPAQVPDRCVASSGKGSKPVSP